MFQFKQCYCLVYCINLFVIALSSCTFCILAVWITTHISFNLTFGLKEITLTNHCGYNLPLAIFITDEKEVQYQPADEKPAS